MLFFMWAQENINFKKHSSKVEITKFFGKIFRNKRFDLKNNLQHNSIFFYSIPEFKNVQNKL